MNAKSILLGAVLASSSLFAAARPHLECTTDRPAVSYVCGETATFTFTQHATNGLTLAWKVEPDYGRPSFGTGDVVKVSLDRPGFVRVSVTAGEGRKALRYTASAAFDFAKILPSYEPPKDFAAFWKERTDAIRAFGFKPELEEIASPTEGVALYKVKMPVVRQGRFVTGYLSVPKDAAKKYPAEANFFGSNESWAKSTRNPPTKCPTDRILFRVMSHPFEVGRDEAYYRHVGHDLRSNGYSIGFDPRQNANPDTCYFVGMALRDATAVSYLKTRPEWNGKDLVVRGFSQGGLQTSWMGALVEGVTELKVASPWLCDLYGFRTGRVPPACDHGEYAEFDPGLAYIDPCFMPRLYPKTLRVDLTRAGLADTCCPPSGLASYYNSIRGAKSVDWWQGASHSGNPYNGQHCVLKEGAK